MGSFKRAPWPLHQRDTGDPGSPGECARGGGHGGGRRVALGPHFSPRLSPGQRGGHGRDAAGTSGWETAQRAARPLAVGPARLGRAEAPGAGGGRPADPTAAHRRFPAALPARPGFRPRPGLARKCAPGRADLSEGGIHARRAWQCGCGRAQTPDSDPPTPWSSTLWRTSRGLPWSSGLKKVEETPTPRVLSCVTHLSR